MKISKSSAHNYSSKHGALNKKTRAFSHLKAEKSAVQNL
jgi:hypothetical protein